MRECEASRLSEYLKHWRHLGGPAKLFLRLSWSKPFALGGGTGGGQKGSPADQGLESCC